MVYKIVAMHCGIREYQRLVMRHTVFTNEDLVFLFGCNVRTIRGDISLSN